jgi:hypothetical protein
MVKFAHRMSRIHAMSRFYSLDAQFYAAPIRRTATAAG